MIMRWYWRRLGGHIHVRVFTGVAKNLTFAKCGDLVFDEREWPRVQTILTSAIEFIHEEAPDK